MGFESLFTGLKRISQDSDCDHFSVGNFCQHRAPTLELTGCPLLSFLYLVFQLIDTELILTV